MAENIVRRNFVCCNGIRVSTVHTPVRYGRLVSLGNPFRIKGKTWQVFECDCGEVCAKPVSPCVQGCTRSCGCYSKEATSARSRRHGMKHTPEYNTWAMVHDRCTNAKNKRYDRYGGRGIKVCDRWREPNGQGFLNFLADMGLKPGPKYSLDRIDNDGDYCPENCRWADAVTQSNNRRNNHYISDGNMRMTISEWARYLDVMPYRILHRIERGMSEKDAVTIPFNPGGKKFEFRRPKPQA